ncbi:Acetolactate synthase large subunit [Pseudorhizobium banfieldiae]|uniref:Acetolactate synthase large subunit n=1 Tax=Pseudorhizobium banfieldiae TaxID=1125847 RepID=L0NCC2_9HYPH|nr:thiamine pyrophosphate-requiring protein [Pseudorhizobium banfieldiae]CAD6603559.1 acetolactate synthase [arsenite-oxidising bacterium NT-25]CCF18743.1 Acetolactate synthase large subunit [Pseudorhizobium banfieldiae]
MKSRKRSYTSRAGHTGAENLLLGLKRAGIDYVFANAGTDFPPIIEALAWLDPDIVPQAVTVPHETAGVAMAHGYYLVTGEQQAVMVHVNVGLANSAMGIINAASDNIPVVMMSGRTPITESGRPGARMTPIQYGQEMYDQASLVSDVTKFSYELRYPEQGDMLALRAASIAMSEPRGPVYISLPREPLMETIKEEAARPAADVCTSSDPYPDPDLIRQAADWLSGAKNPLILCQRGDPQGRVAAEIAALAEAHSIAVAEPFSIRNIMASDHPMFLGYDVKRALAEADVVLVVDSAVPWMETLHRPEEATKIIHIGADPNFVRMPVRGYQADLAITTNPGAGVKAIRLAMATADASAEVRGSDIRSRSQMRLAAAQEAALAGRGSPMSSEWLSHCIGEVMDKNAVVFGELGVVPSAMRIKGPNRIFSNPHSGGLGWALPAALGAQLADRDRLVIACVGDGSYMFANPPACHQIAEALSLPILTIVKNNGMWNAVRRSVINSYPDGVAARSNAMPLTSLEPAPDYSMIAAASRAYVEKVEDGRDLPAALERAVAVIKNERRQAMLDVRVALSDTH